MVEIRTITCMEELKEFFYADLHMVRASFSDEDVELCEKGLYTPSSKYGWVGTYSDGKLIGTLKYSMITQILAETHIAFHSEYWGQEILDTSADLMADHLTKTTPICKMLAMTPRCCTNVLNFLAKHGFQVDGILSSSIYWRGKLEDFIIMTKDLNRRQDARDSI